MNPNLGLAIAEILDVNSVVEFLGSIGVDRESALLSEITTSCKAIIAFVLK